MIVKNSILSVINNALTMFLFNNHKKTAFSFILKAVFNLLDSILILQNRRIEYSRLGSQNPHPSFEPLGSSMVVHRNIIRYPRALREGLNSYPPNY